MHTTLVFLTTAQVSSAEISEVIPDWEKKSGQKEGRRKGSGDEEGRKRRKNSSKEKGKTGGQLKYPSNLMK